MNGKWNVWAVEWASKLMVEWADGQVEGLSESRCSEVWPGGLIDGHLNARMDF